MTDSSGILSISTEWLNSVSWIGEDVQGEEFSAYSAVSSSGWRITARELSKQFAGQFWVSAAGVTWVVGRDVTYIVDPDMLPHVLNARSACHTLSCGKGGTIGSCARRLLSWVARRQACSNVPEGITLANWNYIESTPGIYKQAMLYDVQSCYWSLFCRLPSLRLSHRQGEIIWHTMEEDELSRLTDLQAVIAREKVLRNALVGVCKGGAGPRCYYCRGEKRSLAPQTGPFARAANLIYRSAWELCRRAAEEVGAVYACVDSVASLGPRPHAWEAVGLSTRIIAAGWSDICRPGVYRVGRKATHDYRRGIRSRVKINRPAALEKEVYKLWL